MTDDSAPWPAPGGPPVGWHDGVDGRRFFDGRQWSEPEAPVVHVRTAVSVLVVLAASLLLSRIAVVVSDSAGIPVVVLAVVLVVAGYGPPAWWCLRAVRQMVGTRWRVAIGWSARWVDLGWGLLAWLVAVLVQGVVLAVLLAIGVPVASNAEGLTDADLPLWFLMATGVAAVVVAPIVEELVFRGVVLSALRSRIGALPAILLQGLTFGAVHADPYYGWANVGLVLVLGTVGVVFGAVAHLTGRLAPAMIAHAVFNGVVLIVVFVGLSPA